MKKTLLLLFFLVTFAQYGQTLSKTHPIYEYKDQIVMNDGKRYKTLNEVPFYEVTDQSIEKYKQVSDHTFRLNRVLVLRGKNDYRELIEWIKDDMKFYQIRDLDKSRINQDHITQY